MNTTFSQALNSMLVSMAYEVCQLVAIQGCDCVVKLAVVLNKHSVCVSDEMVERALDALVHWGIPPAAPVAGDAVSGDPSLGITPSIVLCGLANLRILVLRAPYGTGESCV